MRNETRGISYQIRKILAVEFPALGIHTQGKSKAEAYEMAKDALEAVVDKLNDQGSCCKNE